VSGQPNIVLPLLHLQPKTVLIYSCEEVVGDGIMKLAFAQELRRRFPDAKISWLAGTGKTVYAGLLRSIAEKFLDEIIEDAGIGNKTHQLLTMWSPMPGRSFDLIIDTQRLVARTMIVKRIPHGCFVSGTANFLFSDVKPPKNAQADPSLIGGLIDLLNLVSEIPEGDPGPVFEISAQHHATAEQMLPSGQKYVGIAPGAGDRRKLWPLVRYFELARVQLEKGRVPVFLLGPDEAELVDQVRREVPGALLPEWNRTDGNPEIKGPLLVMALAARFSAAISNNSGTGHMLAVGGAPLVSIFTQHDPEKYGAQARVLKILHAALDYGSEDAANIPLSAAVNAIDQFVENEQPLRS
jgi:ADP-heptose:LPS heptosyltransferase